jgi:hypothetical protein
MSNFGSVVSEDLTSDFRRWLRTAHRIEMKTRNIGSFELTGLFDAPFQTDGSHIFFRFGFFNLLYKLIGKVDVKVLSQ